MNYKQTILLNANAMRNPGFTSNAIRLLVEDVNRCNGTTAALRWITGIREGLGGELNRAEILLDGGVGVHKRIETIPKGIRIGVLGPVPLSCPIQPSQLGPKTKDEDIMFAGFNKETGELEAYVIGKEDAVSLAHRSSGVRIITQIVNFMCACRLALTVAASTIFVVIPIINFSVGSVVRSAMGVGILVVYNAWAKRMESKYGFSSKIGNPIYAETMLARLQEAKTCILEELDKVEKQLLAQSVTSTA